jgi:hypothetical protein
MDIATATILVNALVALMAATPQIVAIIQGLDAPDEDKQALIDRVKAAQASLPVWE